MVAVLRSYKETGNMRKALSQARASYEERVLDKTLAQHAKLEI
jgi:hypothetical protein